MISDAQFVAYGCEKYGRGFIRALAALSEGQFDELCPDGVIPAISVREPRLSPESAKTHHTLTPPDRDKLRVLGLGDVEIPSDVRAVQFVAVMTDGLVYRRELVGTRTNGERVVLWSESQSAGEPGGSEAHPEAKS